MIPVSYICNYVKDPLLKFQFITVGHLVLLAMDLSGTKTISEIPASYATLKTIEQKKKWLENLACMVLQIVWQNHDIKGVETAAFIYLNGGDDDDVDLNRCICQEGKHQKPVKYRQW